MKKREPEIIFNVHNDCELEALAKAYVQATNARGMNATQAKDIIAQIWREDIAEPRKKENLLQMPLEETPEQKEFREKVKKFMDYYPEFNFCSPESSRSQFLKEYAIEIICAIFKMFDEEDYITLSSMTRYLRDYFKQTSRDPYYYNYRHIDRFPQRLLSKVDNLYFRNTGKHSTINYCFMCVDASFMPIFSSEHLADQNYSKIHSLIEPYQKRNEYDCRMNPTVISIINLIWVIETFF